MQNEIFDIVHELSVTLIMLESLFIHFLTYRSLTIRNVESNEKRNVYILCFVII